jgi:rhodanese-related sulfurtransferase
MPIKYLPLIASISLLPALLLEAAAEDLAVGITRSIAKFEGTVNGMPITIMRNQDQAATVNPAFAKTSRKCPPFCIQPMNLGSGVETIGEIEVIEYIERMAAGDDSILVIDSRTPNWVSRGTIPGAVNIPWTLLNPSKGADPISISEILTDRFGAKELEGLWDFSEAKTLVMFCNGMWCGQSPNNIANLMRFGYPAEKLKWYRGGMQDWEILGLSTAKP